MSVFIVPSNDPNLESDTHNLVRCLIDQTTGGEERDKKPETERHEHHVCNVRNGELGEYGALEVGVTVLALPPRESYHGDLQGAWES